LYTPTDVAFSVLKPEEDVRKFLPLIPAALALYGGYRGAQNLQNREVSNPLFGTTMAQGDDTWGSRFLQFGTGALEGYMPARTAVAGARVLGARAAAKQAARRGQHAATKRTLGAKTADKIHPAKVRQGGLAGKARDRFGKINVRPSAKTATLGLAGGALAATDNALPALGAAIGSLVPGTESEVPGGGMGGGSGMGGGMGGGGTGQYGHGDPSGGVQGVNNVGTHGVADHDIFRQTNDSNFGATQKGEIMTFTNKKGNEMLYKTLNELDKMHCGTEQKAECPKCGKNCKCDEEKKADDGDKKKKPAHGMVIVIGSKNSGPGPSTEGKRDSKD